MAEYEKRTVLNSEALKPFYDRASEAEDRLSRLEAALAKEKDAAKEEYLEKIRKLEAELEIAKETAKAESEKAEKLARENVKLEYRINHLVRAVREADLKLESKSKE